MLITGAFIITKIWVHTQTKRVTQKFIAHGLMNIKDQDE